MKIVPAHTLKIIFIFSLSVWAMALQCKRELITLLDKSKSTEGINPPLIEI